MEKTKVGAPSALWGSQGKADRHFGKAGPEVSARELWSRNNRGVRRTGTWVDELGSREGKIQHIHGNLEHGTGSGNRQLRVFR